MQRRTIIRYAAVAFVFVLMSVASCLYYVAKIVLRNSDYIDPPSTQMPEGYKARLSDGTFATTELGNTLFFRTEQDAAAYSKSYDKK